MPVFRICSIGCGDGTLDKLVLTSICEKFPHVAIHYCGCDINEHFVQEARESLAQLGNVQVEVLMEDFQKVGGIFAPCDLVLCSQVLFFVESLETALSSMMHLTKEGGKTILIPAQVFLKPRMAWLLFWYSILMIVLFSVGVAMVIQVRQSTQSQLYRRFWLHEHQWPIKLADDVAHTLNKMGIEYSAQEIDGTADFSDCFKKDFQDPRQERLLDFLTHTQISKYPPLIRKTCIDYLSSVSSRKPGQYVFTRVTTVFYIPKK